ncbi:MAG TPA: hypothetical protein VFW62_07170 [bacterium]|nr:hypothetical protein [bacterium]
MQHEARLNNCNNGMKWALTAYLFLASLGFGVAALMSQLHYGLDHQKTIVHYLGNEAQGGMEMAKLYAQLLQTAHVHSFTMPLVFLSLWVALAFTPTSSAFKKLLIAGGALSVLFYNAAPFLVRFHSPDWVFLFTVGGVGLFLFFFLPAALVLYEIWWGLKDRATSRP